MEKLRPIYWNLTSFSGIEIDLTNGLLYGICQKYPLQTQEKYLSKIISVIADQQRPRESGNDDDDELLISIRLSCLQNINLITHSNLLYSNKISLIHLVDVRPAFLKHFSLLRLLTHFDGMYPPIEEQAGDVLLFQRKQFPSLSGYLNLGLKKFAPKRSGSYGSRGSNSNVSVDASSNHSISPPPSSAASSSSSTSHSLNIFQRQQQQQQNQFYSTSAPTMINGSTTAAAVSIASPNSNNSLRPPSPIRRAGSPFKIRKTGFQDIDDLEFDQIDSITTTQTRPIVVNSPDQLLVWGRVILSVTWTGFILGIASVLGVYPFSSSASSSLSSIGGVSDYEEQTGFPIRNYYPSLLCLCIVVAWVWCIISWMGMKFFRHAKGGSSSSISSD